MKRIWLAGLGSAVLVLGVPALASAGGYSTAPHRSYAPPAAAASGHTLRPAHPAHPFHSHPLRTAGAKFNLVNSTNWSGFSAYGDHFRYISTTYSIPSVNCAASPDGSYDSQWVGLDGYTNSTTVEQIGTFAECSSGTPTYYAFYEMYPNPPASLTGVSPGDSISVNVYYNRSNSKWNLTLTDNTTGYAVHEVESCPSGSTCGNTSAEVISEVPGGGPPNYSLADYGTVGFTQIAITDYAGHHNNFISSYWKNDKIFEVDTSGTMMQRPSKFEGSKSGLGGGSGNQAFTDTALSSS